jgi:hypothetical protein
MAGKSSTGRSYVPRDKVFVHPRSWNLKEGVALYYELKPASGSSKFWGYKLRVELSTEGAKGSSESATILNDNLPASSVLMMLEDQEGSQDLTKTAVLQLFTEKVEFVIHGAGQDLSVEIVYLAQFGGISRFSRKISPNVWSKFFEYAIEEE